jgi:hypothetical protein
MASSKTEIANRALTKLGQTSVLLITDDNAAARVMNRIFDSVADSEVQDNRWKFAIARTQLSPLVAAPVDGSYRYQYPLPMDYLALIQVGDFYARTYSSSRTRWSVEGTNILTDLPPPLNFRYTQRITNVALFTPMFVEALASRLAMEACETLTQSDTKYQRVEKQYAVALARAARADAIENPPDELPEGSWLDSRESGSSLGLFDSTFP